MKKYIFPLLLLGLVSGGNKTFAQASKTHEAPQAVASHRAHMSASQIQDRETQMAQNIANAYDSKLSLSADQKQKISDLCMNFGMSANEQRTGRHVDAKTNQKNMAELDSKIKALLTTEQIQKLQAMRAIPGSGNKKN